MVSIDWPTPWKTVEDRHAKYIGRELMWELSHFPEHPLANRPFRVLAMMDTYENAIIQLDDGGFAYVRLTWRQASPHFERVGSDAELVPFLKGRAAAD